MMNQEKINPSEFNKESMLPLLRSALVPFELFLGLVVISRNKDNLTVITEALAGLLAEAGSIMDSLDDMGKPEEQACLH